MNLENKTSPEKEHRPFCNLLTSYKETMDAMAEIEGEAWLRLQSNESSTYSAAWALKFVHEARSMNDIEADSQISHDDNVVVVKIYGNSGINRWYVKIDGSVEFSAFHADQDVIEKVKKLGFKIFK